MTLEEKIVTWIRSAKHDTGASAGKLLERMELVHYGASKESTLWAREGLTRESDERELAIAIEDTAQRDANSLGGYQSYGLRGFYEGQKKKAGFPFRFRVQAETSEMEGRDLDSEPATEKGVAKMMMRHTEAAVKMSLGASSSMFGFLERQNERLQQRIEELEKKNSEVLNMYERLMSLQHEREMASIKFTKDEDRKDDLISTLKTIGPGVVNRISGSEIFPGAKDPAIIEIQAFMSTLTPDQLPKLASVLKPEQSAALMSLINNNLKVLKDE